MGQAGRWRAAVGVMAGRRSGRAGSAQMRALARHGMPFLLLGFLLWAGRERLMALDWQAVLETALAMPPLAWGGALVATAVSFAAVGHYDALVHRLIGTGVPKRHAARSGMAAIAISQMAGMGLVTGTLTRWHLLPGLTLAQAGKVTLTVTVSFLGAWGLVTGLAVLALVPADLPHAGALQMAAAALVVLALGAALVALIAPGIRVAGRAFDWPPLAILARFALMAAIDLGAAAVVLYIFLPDAAGAFAPFLPVFLIAYGVGLLFGTPGGIGPFELTLAALSPALGAEALAAAVLCYRIAYFALPALLAVILVAGGWLSTSADAGAPTSRARFAQAEAGLRRQGHLEVLPGPHGNGWLVGRAGQVLVGLLDPARDASVMLERLQMAASGRGLSPALYKVSARTALAARARGWQVLPVAEECWIEPARFTLDGPARATLRRKIRHAERAGVGVTLRPTGGALPLVEMTWLNHDWAGRHGGERGFSMGRFAPDYLAGQRLYLAWAGGELAGFVSFHVGAADWTLDLVRARADAPDGTIPALILAAIADAARVGIPRLSLAARPLPGCGLSGVAARAAERIALRSGAEGLRRFKAMFAPCTTRLYLAAPSRPALLLAAAEIARAVRWPGPLPDPERVGATVGSDMSEIQLDPDEVEFDSCRAA